MLFSAATEVLGSVVSLAKVSVSAAVLAETSDAAVSLADAVSSADEVDGGTEVGAEQAFSRSRPIKIKDKIRIYCFAFIKKYLFL